jgi:hypothetical protein
MEEETDTKYERKGETPISSSVRKAFKFSIDKSKFNYWSLFEKEFIFLKDTWSGGKSTDSFIPEYSHLSQNIPVLFPLKRHQLTFCSQNPENARKK